MKRGKHPTTSRRSKKQKVKARYAKAREDAQLEGVISTEPAGAVRPERVDPSKQGEQSLPGIDRAAIRQGWAVPEHLKPVLVDRLIEPFVEPLQQIQTKDGTVITIPPDRHLLKENFKALSIADRMQWERDHPEEAARGDTNVNIQINFEQLLGRPTIVDPVEQKIKELENAAVRREADQGGAEDAAGTVLGAGLPRHAAPESPNGHGKS